MKTGYTYIMSNKNRSTFYIGVTAELQERVGGHKDGIGSKFTTRYKCYDLVYFEQFLNIDEAIKREKQLEELDRQWKIDLILSVNPEMKVLAEDSW
jgi:putative endonuclease